MTIEEVRTQLKKIEHKPIQFLCGYANVISVNVGDIHTIQHQTGSGKIWDEEKGEISLLIEACWEVFFGNRLVDEYQTYDRYEENQLFSKMSEKPIKKVTLQENPFILIFESETGYSLRLNNKGLINNNLWTLFFNTGDKRYITTYENGQFMEKFAELS